ncbi:MAG: hypothetical protein AB7S44_01435 [Spirochaetales bacterium]
MQESKFNKSLILTLISTLSILFALVTFVGTLAINNALWLNVFVSILILLIPAILGAIFTATKNYTGVKVYLVGNIIMLIFLVVMITFTSSWEHFDITEALIFLDPVLNLILSIILALAFKPEKERKNKVTNLAKTNDKSKKLVKVFSAISLVLFVVSVILPFYEGSGEIMGIPFSASISIANIDNALLYMLLIILPILTLFLLSMMIKIKKDIFGMLGIIMSVVYFVVFYVLTKFSFEYAAVGLYLYIVGFITLILTTIFSFKIKDDVEIKAETLSLVDEIKNRHI